MVQTLNQLPIEEILGTLQAALSDYHNVVLSAEPGAGKTTRVPIALLDAEWMSEKKVVMLEPRRLAAQRAAAYMAQQLGEKVGETVGYRIRGDRMVGKRTRIEVVTEGILTRMLQSEPELPGVGLVIFDEFHERSIHADLALAFALDVQVHLRPELRLLVMSATLDGIAVSSILGNAPIIKSEGRTFPVTIHYLEHAVEIHRERLAVRAIVGALKKESGDILVFLPGQKEIRRVESLLAEELAALNADGDEESQMARVSFHSLYGNASYQKQQAALAPAAKGSRKVILSTNIAETSLTIDGVQVVIDAGLAREPRFDPRRGMSALVTTAVSRASADQRCGRAGRQQPGVCYRLWTEAQQRELPRFSQPEILTTDLAPMASELALWGDPEGSGLMFLDRPPPAHLSQARTLLSNLGACSTDGKLTPHGKAMSKIPIHPRLSHMVIRGSELGLGTLACDVAALLEERDLLRSDNDTDIDLYSRWHVLRKGGRCDRFARDRAVAQSSRLRAMIGATDSAGNEDKLGILLALAYPERVAKRRDEKYQLAGGPVAILPKGSLLSRERYLAVGDVDGAGNEVRVFLASAIEEKDIMQVFSDRLKTEDEIRWDELRQKITARRVVLLGSIELSESPYHPTAEQCRDVLLNAIRAMGIGCLNWTKAAIAFRTRSEWLRKTGLTDSDWPTLSEEHLLSTMETWLLPFIGGITKRSQLEDLDILSILKKSFSHRQMQELDRLAPAHITVPTGSTIALDYRGERPILGVRLQEMFGEKETPCVAGGRVKVVVHLLSPALRPLAVTQDMPSFWKNAYPDVRKDMRGQYPKHHWPEDPLLAKPTRSPKRRR